MESQLRFFLWQHTLILTHLLGSISKEVFFSKFWEKEPLHLAHPDPRRFNHLFSLEQLDHLFSTLPRDTPITLIKNDMNKPDQPGIKSNSSAAVCDLYNKFAEGQTIIVNALHTFWGPVKELCAHMTAELGLKTKANMYVTPKASMGFSPHWDDHEVMILQIAGQKNWRIYGNGPLLPQKTDQDIVAAMSQRTLNPGEPVREMTLKPGDFLYLPRGWVHNARATDTTSAHITIGLNPITWEALLISAIQGMSKQQVGLRRSIPMGTLVADQPPMVELQKACQNLLSQVREDLDLPAALNILKRSLVNGQEPLPSGHFCQLDGLDTIDLDTLVERRTKAITLFVEEPHYVTLLWPGHFQQGPTKMGLALEFIAKHPSFRVRDIPGWYSDREKCLTVRHLIKKGLLQMAGRDGTFP